MKSIQEVIQNLGIQAENKGASTGAVWFNTSGAAIDSYSPVDGKLIAKINS